MIKHRDSHVDHGLTEAQLHYLLERFAKRDSFFIETITLPPELGTVPCGLYGPLMGDSAIREDAVTYARRGDRAWDSRLVGLPARQQHEVTVIAGPHAETCTTCKGNLVHLVGGEPDAHPMIAASLGPFVGCDHCDGTGKLQHACILYTAFGGPAAPQEPDDPGCKDPAASATFWREHALAG
jgi:hypothetical protein